MRRRDFRFWIALLAGCAIATTFTMVITVPNERQKAYELGVEDGRRLSEEELRLDTPPFDTIRPCP